MSGVLRGLARWVAGGPDARLEISPAWSVTQHMWTAPDACTRGEG